jgi:predicted transcriptional regulator
MGMTSVRMPDDLMERLDATAARLRRSKGWVINDAVREYLEREELQQRRDQETREALAELEAGSLVDGDDVLAWLDSWGSDNELEPPR